AADQQRRTHDQIAQRPPRAAGNRVVSDQCDHAQRGHHAQPQPQPRQQTGAAQGGSPPAQVDHAQPGPAQQATHPGQGPSQQEQAFTIGHVAVAVEEDVQRQPGHAATGDQRGQPQQQRLRDVQAP
ncbi:hypothetical protein B8W90_11440, partial [Staphylococcus hominis]